MEFTLGDRRVSFERKDDSLVMTYPAGVSGTADSDRDFYSVISYRKMKSIVAEPAPEDLSPYGLFPPRATINVTKNDGETIGPLYLGDPVERER